MKQCQITIKFFKLLVFLLISLWVGYEQFVDCHNADKQWLKSDMLAFEGNSGLGVKGSNVGTRDLFAKNGILDSSKKWKGSSFA